MPIGRLELAGRAMEAARLTEILLRLDAWKGVLVLTFHRIGRPEESVLNRDVFSATPDDFQAQMATLAAHFEVIEADDLERAFARPRGRAVAITFDDGYRDNFVHALPVLRRLGLPATFFVTAGLLDRPRLPWWDEVAWRVGGDVLAPRKLAEQLQLNLPIESPAATSVALLERYKRLPAPAAMQLLERVREVANEPTSPVDVEDLWMTWAMVRELMGAGMSIGAHTMTHPVLTSLGEDGQDEEIGRSLERVRREMGRSTALFAYPVGLPFTYDRVTRRVLARHGVDYAFAFSGGYVRHPAFDRFAVPRTSVSAGMSLGRFRSLVGLPRLFARW
jgi:peptidoglycan/xylan/chitin deacetylase (PgdA/CDA1 family)